MSKYVIEQLDQIEPVTCPCGQARRAFGLDEDKRATMHIVEISKDSRTHYHKNLTEVYLVLEGRGHIELDGESFPLRPLTAVMIKPLCRHRAVGELKIVNVVIPAFDPDDEWFDNENE